MNNKISARFWGFHPRIFREGFRQLKTIGILSLIILTLEAILIPVGIAISELSVEEPLYSRRLVSLLNMHPMLLAIILLAPLMTVMVFQFVNHRKSSDFYHALPVSRSTLFISLFAAVMTWILLIAILSTGVSLIATACFPMLFQITYSSIFPLMASAVSGALLLAGCAAVAMCITGTLFTNLLVAGLIFFTPRALMIYVSEILQNIVHIMPSQYNNPLLDLSYNIPYALVGYVFTGDNLNSILLDNPMGYLYTALIGVALFLLANLLFRIRHSEAAGQSASTPLFQTVYRLLVTFLVTLIPVAVIVDRFTTSDHHISGEDLFILLVLYLIAAVAFCVYELITTKKPRLLLKAAPSFLIVLAADAVLLAGLAGGYFALLSFRPAASEIQSVSLSQRSYQDDYFSARSKEVAITDPEIAKIVSERLETAARLNNPYGGLTATEANYSFTFQTTIRTGGIARQRWIAFTQEQTQDILDSLSAVPSYQSIYTLPALSSNVSVSLYELDQEQMDQIYRLMVQEINALPFDTRYALLSERTYGEKAIADLYVTANYRGALYHFSLPLTYELTPQAYKQYLTYIFESNSKEDKTMIREALKTATWEEINKKDLYLNLYLPGQGSGYHINFLRLSEKEVPLFARQLETGLLDKTAGSEDAFCEIMYQYPSENDQLWIQRNAYFTLTDEALELLKRLDGDAFSKEIFIVE